MPPACAAATPLHPRWDETTKMKLPKSSIYHLQEVLKQLKSRVFLRICRNPPHGSEATSGEIGSQLAPAPSVREGQDGLSSFFLPQIAWEFLNLGLFILSSLWGYCLSAWDVPRVLASGMGYLRMALNIVSMFASPQPGAPQSNGDKFFLGEFPNKSVIGRGP